MAYITLWKSPFPSVSSIIVKKKKSIPSQKTEKKKTDIHFENVEDFGKNKSVIHKLTQHKILIILK